LKAGLGWTVLPEAPPHSPCAEPAPAIDWGLPTGGKGGAQAKRRGNTDCSGVGKLSSTLVSGRETFGCRRWLGVQFGQRLRGMVGPYWETGGGNAKQLIAVGRGT